MENIDKYYVLFAEADFHFLLPLSWVAYIEDGNKKHEESVFFSILYGKIMSGQSRYRICLQRDKSRFDVAAEKVLGVRCIEESECIELKKPVINAGNTYLKAVALLEESREQKIPSYILNMDMLVKKEALWNI